MQEKKQSPEPHEEIYQKDVPQPKIYMSRYKNYLNELRHKEINERSDSLNTVNWDKKIEHGSVDSYAKVLKEAEEIDRWAKRKELHIKTKHYSNTISIQEDKNEIDKQYYSSIKAKLAVLSNFYSP